MFNFCLALYPRLGKNGVLRRFSDKGVTILVTPSGIQSVTVLEESGIYQLIFSSKLPSAEKFQDWVFEEVLPAIRKTGQYAIAHHRVPQSYSEALLEAGRLAQEKEILEEQKRLLEEQNEYLSEAVDELFNYSSIMGELINSHLVHCASD